MKCHLAGLALIVLTSQAVAQEAAPRRAQLWAIVASVGRYDDPDLAARPGLAEDGKALAVYLEKTAGWPADHVIVLDENGEDAPDPAGTGQLHLRSTGKNLRWATQVWLRSRASRGDVVLFVFSGQAGRGNAEEWLWPVDAKSEAIERDGWSPSEAISLALGTIKCVQTLCVIDAPIREPGRTTDATVAGTGLLDRLAFWPGSAVWMASIPRPGAGGAGSAFASAFRKALGTPTLPMLATLRELDREATRKGLGFRQRGGVPPGLTPSQDGLQTRTDRGPELLLQSGHADRISAMLVRPDGRTLLTASDDSTIRIWKPLARERSLLRIIPGFVNRVTALAMTTDGRHVAGGDGMGEVCVWDLADPGSPRLDRGRPSPHNARIASIHFIAHAPGEIDRRFISLDESEQGFSWLARGRELDFSPKPLLGGKAVCVAAASDPGGPAALVIAGDDRKLHVFDRDVRQVRELRLPFDRAIAISLSPDGRWAAVSDRAGRVLAVDLSSPDPRFNETLFPAPIGGLAIGQGGLLAIGTGRGVRVASLGKLDAAVRIEGLDDEVTTVEFSVDGQWLGALTTTGTFGLWKLKPDGGFERRDLAHPEGASRFAFGPESGGAFVALGGLDGSLRRWDLEATPRPLEVPAIAPRRGKVESIAASPDGRRFVQINDDGKAQLWDFAEGRTVRVLAGTWKDGAFLADGRLVLVAHADHGGWPRFVDASTCVVGVPLPRPRQGKTIEDLDKAVASQSGLRIAAATSRGRTGIVYVWDLKDGSCRTIGGWESSVAAIDLSADGLTLLSATEDGKVQLWDIASLENEPRLRKVFEDSALGTPTAVRLGPDGLVVAAGLGTAGRGVVSTWTWDPADVNMKSDFRRVGEVAGYVNAMTFLNGGRYLAVAGEGRRIHAWDFTDRRRPIELRVSSNPNKPAQPNHHERINDLLNYPCPDKSILASASSDSTVRFWRIDPKSSELLGTITSSPDTATPGPADPTPPRAGEAQWIAFTSEGIFDGSQDGESLVSFVDGERVHAIDSYAKRLFRPFLTEDFRHGNKPRPDPFSAPLPLRLELARPVDLDVADVEVRVAFNDPDVRRDSIRLYQNGTPIRDGADFTEARPGSLSTKVRLTRGDNRFHAMASRPDEVDARSDDLWMHHTGPMVKGRVHVVALGVGNYHRNALRYPVKDAKEMAKAMASRVLSPSQLAGRAIVLTDVEVNEKAIESEFAKLRREVKDHPEDTVVVFLAGHADLVKDAEGRSLYSLLLPTYPFPSDAPRLAMNRGVEAIGPGGVPADAYLSYANIYKNLSHLQALQRLVIIDACQAEAAINDPGVARIDRLRAVDREARMTRTAYLLATRRGEAASESSALDHGLLTYVVLRGIGAKDLKAAPAEIASLRPGVTADLDGDGRITTGEIRQFVDVNLPTLSNLPGVVRSPGKESLLPRSAGTSGVQVGGDSFPLFVTPVKTTRLP